MKKLIYLLLLLIPYLAFPQAAPVKYGMVWSKVDTTSYGYLPFTGGYLGGIRFNQLSAKWQYSEDGGATWKYFAAGTIGGSGATNRVAYWAGTNTLSSNSGFTFSSGLVTVPSLSLTSISGPLVGNGAGAVTAAVSGTDFRTINGASIIGPGNITISTGLTIGSTPIASGTDTKVLYDNSGTLGEYTVSGSGNVAMTTSPSFTTPNIGAATATSVNGVGISGSSTPSIAVTGSASISGTNTGDQTTITGNAGTATALQTARTIGTITGDATSSGSSFDGTANNTNAITVTKLNGTSLAGLATGLLKNTTGTGVPSIAVAGTDYLSTANIEDAINDGETTKAPTENATYDALQLKVDKSANLTDLASGPTALKNIGGIERAAVSNTQTGSAYTLQLSDFSSLTELLMNSGSAQTITIPLNAVTAIPAGVTVYGRTLGAGTVSVTIGGGGTIVSANGSLIAPGESRIWALTKRPGTTDTWDFDNGDVSLGSANQLRAVNSLGTSEEYKTVSNGLTSATGTVKLGGALTADTNLSGAFSLGIGATPSAKLHVVGLGTTTGELLRLADNTPTTRLSILDNGSKTETASISGTGVTAFTSNITATLTANTQTQNGWDNVFTFVPGAFTGYTYNILRYRDAAGGNDYFSIAKSSTNAISTIFNASLYDFKNNTSLAIIRNSAANLSLRGGTSSTTTMLEFQATNSSSTNNNITFNFTGNNHNLGTAQTRTFKSIVNDASTTSVNGSTITYTIFDNIPSFTLGTSTATLTGYNYNPTLTSGTFTHYANRWQSGLSAFGSAVPLSTVDNQGSQGHAITSTSADLTLDITHYTIKVDASGANRTITLPAAASNSRRVYIIKKTDSSGNTVTVDGNASETIDGATTYVMSTQWKYVMIQCDGSNWMITANN